MKQKEEMQATSGSKPSESKKENEEPVTFKSGGALPSVTDAPSAKKSSVFDFPSLGAGKGEADKDLASKAKKMFDDLDLDDEDANDKRAELDFEQGSDDEDGSKDFNANELLNLTDYQNKRQAKETKKLQPPKAISIKDVFDDKKRENLNRMAEEEEDDDGWGDSGDWGDTKKVPEAIKMSKNEMKNKNLNQLSDRELAAHKKGMD